MDKVLLCLCRKSYIFYMLHLSHIFCMNMVCVCFVGLQCYWNGEGRVGLCDHGCCVCLYNHGYCRLVCVSPHVHQSSEASTSLSRIGSLTVGTSCVTNFSKDEYRHRHRHTHTHTHTHTHAHTRTRTRAHTCTYHNDLSRQKKIPSIEPCYMKVHPFAMIFATQIHL